jgi:hypothetical protein
MKNTIKYWVACIMLAALFTVSLFAQVVAGPDSMPAPPEPSTPWWITVLAITATVIGSIFAWIGKLIATKLKLSQTQADAMDACTAAVAQTYQDYVKELKKSGKFGATEKALAKEKAMSLAKELAKGPAKDLLLSYGKEHIGAWIEQIVTKLKGGTKLENGVIDVPATITPATPAK